MKAAVGMIPKTSSTLHFLFLVASTFLDITSLNAANVSEFGFDPADSTEIIQRALDSGVHQLVFDRQAGPWVTRPLFVRSNTEIVFEDGVELVAKRGEFHGIHDRLLELRGVTNVSIVGRGPHGGVLRMRKTDYQKKPYEPSEHRHALALAGVVDVRVENMSFIASGGDGIYLGANKSNGGLNHCRNVAVRRCISDNNLRQGISVCSAVNFLVEDSVLKNTDGGLPKAGIDFEPNNPGELIVDCRMRRCRVEGNAASGIEIYLELQDSRSKPIGIDVEDCFIVGNGGCGINMNIGSATKPNPPSGRINFSRCHMAKNRGGGVLVHGKPVSDFPVTFEDCVVSNQSKSVSFCVDGWPVPMPDGVEFRNLRVEYPAGSDWIFPCIECRGLNPYVPTNISGDVTMVRPDGWCEKLKLNVDWCREKFALTNSRMPPERVKAWPDVAFCVVHDEKPGQMVRLASVGRKSCGLRGMSYAFFADRPGSVSFRARYVQIYAGLFARPQDGLFIGKGSFDHGRKKHLAMLPSPRTTSEVFSVTVPERGFYYLTGTSGLAPFLLEEANVPVAIQVCKPNLLVPMTKEGTAMYLYVPDGIERFALIVKDFTCVRLSAPDGTSAGEIVSNGNAWTAIQPQNPAEGLWRIDVKKNYKNLDNISYRIDLTGIPGLIWLSKEKTVSWR